jgi:HD-GYP domain-containing protein (c-di-GMP phosphodiesterase class II)
VEDGHAHRVARLAVRVGRELGMSEPNLLELEYAAPVGSRIIRAANAFDDLVGASADPCQAATALERPRLDTASEFDPRVVEALSNVVGRRRASLY